MKARLILFLICAGALRAEDSIRILGTNAVDFSLVYREESTPHAHGFQRPVWWFDRYVARGHVESLRNGVLTLVLTNNVYRLMAIPDARTDNEIKHLQLATKLAGPSKAIDYWMYRALPLQQVRYFYHDETVTRVLVRNYPGPSAPGVPGVWTGVVAWPLALNVFDYGTVFRGRVEDLPDVFTPGPDGVTGRRETERRARASESARRVGEENMLKRQREDAEAGIGSAQYELGKRYLRGMGTETNLALAKRWLTAARTNGYDQAAARLLDGIK